MSTLTIQCLHPGTGAFLTAPPRTGRAHLGIPRGGPADRFAAARANVLLQQSPDHPCLELTHTPGRWLLSGRGQLAIAGADMNLRLNGRLLERQMVQYLDGDYLLAGTQGQGGARLYLAVAGDWRVEFPLVATPLKSGWSCTVEGAGEVPFAVDLEMERHRFSGEEPFALSVVAGPEWEETPTHVRRWLTGTVFTLSPQSSRQGWRLVAPAPPAGIRNTLLSSAVTPGTVQLSPSGPIILGPDAQTPGGYPRVLLLERQRTLDRLYQCRPGVRVRFTF